jgi:LysR family nitrogen assimilation transcriptional regulator
MDLKQLEHFVRVAELGSFTRASIALDVAQPALSRQLRLLELELRQNLLIRTGRGVKTTEAGKLLLEHARGVLHQIERLKEELDHARGAVTGRVALGLPPSASKLLTVSLSRAFRATHPDAALSIGEGLSSTMQEALATGRLDIALLYNASPSPDIELTPLLVQPLFLVEAGRSDTPPTPIPLHTLAKLPLVIPSRPNAIRMVVETELANLGQRPIVALEIDVVSAILDLVTEGAGCAVLPATAVRSLGGDGAFTLRPIVEPALRVHLAMAVSAHRPATLAQRSVMELLRNAVMELGSAD